MAARPWKHPKTGMFWFRRRVPVDLVEVIGREEEKFSLKTKDAAEAKLRHAEATVIVEKRWRALREPARPITEVEVFEIARIAHERCVDSPALLADWNIELGEDLFNEPEPPTSHSPFELAVAGAGSYFARLPMRALCRNLASQIAREQGVLLGPSDHHSVQFAVSAAVQAAARQAKRDRSLTDVVWAVPTDRRLSPVPSAAKPVRFKTLLDDWALEKQPSEKTLYAWGRVVSQLTAFLKFDDASRVTTDDLVRWKVKLLADGLSGKTIRNGKIAPIKALLNWGFKNRRLATNAASGVDVSVKKKPGEGKRGYSDDEARAVLVAARKERGALRWLPWLSAFTGARLSELCQLRKTDLVNVGGIWSIRILAEAGSVKNVGSERIVPLHQALVDEGFVEFARAQKGEVLFPDLLPDRFGSRGGNGTKLVSRWIRGLGLTDARLSPSHSWRHRFKTLARRHALAPDAVDAIVGHARRSVGDQYGEFEVAGLNRELSKIPPLSG